MIKNSINKILESVVRPSRYLGTEVNTIKKDPKSVKIKFALAFPDLYEIACSHFGIQILYSILNRHPDIMAERVFSPGEDLEEILRKKNIPLFTLESKIPLNEFDIVGFSLLSELNYTNVLNILELSHIPFRARNRDEKFPLIIAGGPCTCNPEPMADFFDAIIIGDGEEVILKIAQSCLQSKDHIRGKKGILDDLQKIGGIYVPSTFNDKVVPVVNSWRDSSQIESSGVLKKIKRAVVKNLDESFFPLSPIVPFSKPVHDRVRMEIARGCSRGCRFCQAGMIYRPVRERSPERILYCVREILKNTGYDDLSLLSLSVGDYCCLDPLLREIMAEFSKKNISISLPSFRAGTLNEETMRLIKKVRKTGFTIAPEAGSQRLRNVINKNITEIEIIETIDNAVRLGWKVIKLYFMLGLPTETEKDLNETVRLVKKIKSGKRKHLQLNVSFAPFIPKAHTPFQWEPQQNISIIREKLRWLKQELNLKGIKIKWQNPELSQVEGLLSKGNRNFSHIIETAFRNGCKFDGWTDNFLYDRWLLAASEHKIDIEKFNSLRKDPDDRLPWDHIDIRVEKRFLKKEYFKAIKEETSQGCGNNDCRKCGNCDQNEIQPIIFNQCKFYSAKESDEKSGNVKKAALNFRKYSSARLFGHLEMANIWKRAFKRAKIKIKFSEGYHPMPKISFEDTLPMAMESLIEKIFITLDYDNTLKPSEIIKKINKELPRGLKVDNCLLFKEKWRNKNQRFQSYIAETKKNEFNNGKINNINQKKISEIFINKNDKIYSLKDLITKIEIIDKKRIKLKIMDLGVKIRPIDILNSIKIIDLSENEKFKYIKID